jgi:hypothetical protein
VRSLQTSYPLRYAVLTLDTFVFICLLIIGVATKSGDFAEPSRLYFVVTTYSYFAELVFVANKHQWDMLSSQKMKIVLIECCTKSPDFVPIAICRSNFSNLYFPVFVDYWNCYEVVRLRRAITIIFCCCDLFILRRAGGALALAGFCITLCSLDNQFLHLSILKV